MRFIVDESSGVAVARHLHRAGYDVLYVGDIMPQAGEFLCGYRKEFSSSLKTVVILTRGMLRMAGRFTPRFE